MSSIHKQRQRSLNVKDLMPQHQNGTLPPAPYYNPKDRNNKWAPPAQAVLNIVPNGKQLIKNKELSSEFTPTVAGSIPPNQRMRWKFNRGWGGRYPGVFQDKNVQFWGDSCVLRATRQFQPPKEMYNWFDDKRIAQRNRKGKPFFGCSFIRTAKTMTYGYTEIGCRLADSAVTCAFWLKELGGTEREIDVFEYTTGRQKGPPQHSRENIHLMTIHQFNSRITGKHEHVNTYIGFDKDLSKEKFFKAGLLWTPQKIYWLVNDVVARELEHNGLFGNDCKMHIQIDREVFDWVIEPNKEDKLQNFRVFYVRTWDLVDKRASENQKRGSNSNKIVNGQRKNFHSVRKVVSNGSLAWNGRRW